MVIAFIISSVFAFLWLFRSYCFQAEADEQERRADSLQARCDKQFIDLSELRKSSVPRQDHDQEVSELRLNLQSMGDSAVSWEKDAKFYMSEYRKVCPQLRDLEGRHHQLTMRYGRLMGFHNALLCRVEDDRLLILDLRHANTLQQATIDELNRQLSYEQHIVSTFKLKENE